MNNTLFYPTFLYKTFFIIIYLTSMNDFTGVDIVWNALFVLKVSTVFEN